MLAPLVVLSALSALVSGDRVPPDLFSGDPDSIEPEWPSIVLITVDALRADRLGLYGCNKETSPNLDTLARDGVVYERAYAPSSSTSFSLASLMIGRHAYAITREANLDGFETLADWLGSLGYETAALYPPAVYYSATNAFAGVRERHFGFGQVVHDALAEDRDAIERTDVAIRILHEHRDRPVFLWAHYFGPHEPYTLHPRMSSLGDAFLSDRERYEDEIRWVDHEIGRLLHYLRVERPNTIVVVTADHGEAFGEHGGRYHGTSLFDEQIRVPLVIQAPGLLPRREATPISTVEVRRILEGILVGPSDSLPNGPEASPVFAELGAQKAVIVGRHKALCDLWKGRCRLFNLADDPSERNDLAAREPRRTRLLRKLIDGWVAADPASDSSASAGSVPDRLRPARRSDRSSARALLSIVQESTASAEDKCEAARLLSNVISRDQRRRVRKLWSPEDSRLNRWLAVGLARVGDRLAKRWLHTLDLGGGTADAEFLAQRAMVLASSPRGIAVARMSHALSHTVDDGTRCQMFVTLGKIGGPAARDVLMSSYGDIRTRNCVAVALSRFRDAITAAFLSETITTESYANIRAVLVRGLGKAGGPRYRAHLEEIRANDSEPIVSAAAEAALATSRKLRAAKPPRI